MTQFKLDKALTRVIQGVGSHSGFCGFLYSPEFLFLICLFIGSSPYCTDEGAS